MIDIKALFNKLNATFEQQADPVRAKGQQRYMKSSMPYFGVSVPGVRKIVSKVSKLYIPETNQDYRMIVQYLFDHATYREQWYAGQQYAEKFKRFVVEDNVDLYLYIIRKAQWWDIVDSTAVNLVGRALLGSRQLSTYLRAWIVDKNMWVRRTALLAQLKYKDKTDFVLLTELILTVIDEKEFFIRKAIGWALRQYSYTDPRAVQQFIAQHEDKLSSLSVREGLKAIKRMKNQ